MEARAEQRGGVTIIVPTGRVDARSAGELAAFLDRHLNAPRPRLVADLSHVEVVTSAGLRALFAALVTARRRGGDLCLAALPPRLGQDLTMSGLTRAFRLFATVEAAVASQDWRSAPPGMPPATMS